MNDNIDLAALYPSLLHLPAQTERSGLDVLQVDKGTVLFRENTACQGFPLVLSGEVKVSRSSADGRSLELYRVRPGELCLVSAASLFKAESLTGCGVTTAASRLILVPAELFHRWLDTRAFRDEVLSLFALRMSDLTSLIDAITFRKLDSRLAMALLAQGDTIHTTHQNLADELGTVREMVSRLLRRFDSEGWVKSGREQIQILDRVALSAFAQGDTPLKSR
jgi:CRP/FNR family transcriptional regulator